MLTYIYIHIDTSEYINIYIIYKYINKTNSYIYVHIYHRQYWESVVYFYCSGN